MPAFAASLALVTDLEANENKIYILAKEWIGLLQKILKIVKAEHNRCITV